jgi:hypothetical protein
MPGSISCRISYPIISPDLLATSAGRRGGFEAEAILDPLEHGLGRGHFGSPAHRGQANIGDDRAPRVD